MKKCRIGVVGVGRGSMMWKYCQDAENAQIVAICDKWEEGLEKAKAQINSDSVTYYTSYEEFLKHDMNTVLVAVPNDYHKDLCIAAMRAGKNVICEKPVAFNVAELDEMLAVSKECGVIFTVQVWTLIYVVYCSVGID